MTDKKDKPNYEVGYKKPPKATQFKAGQSGNRKGRPKGSMNFSTAIEQELNAPVLVTENHKKKNIQKRSAIAKQVVNKAASGDLKATALLLTQARIDEKKQTERGAPAQTLFAEADQMVLESIVQRIRASIVAAPEVQADSSMKPPSSQPQRSENGGQS